MGFQYKKKSMDAGTEPLPTFNRHAKELHCKICVSLFKEIVFFFCFVVNLICFNQF